jgi:DNA-directed RNA polymerase specialized sigma24 family protein
MAIDDVVQETLIIVNRRIGTIHDLGSLAAWLATVITRLCLLPLTISEMAARLALTREATKSRLHRARALLREYLIAREDAR